MIVGLWPFPGFPTWIGRRAAELAGRSLGHDYDSPLADAEADREEWQPNELRPPLSGQATTDTHSWSAAGEVKSHEPPVEPGLSGDELVALRQMIEERFGDQTDAGLRIPAQWLTPKGNTEIAEQILAVLRAHHAITYWTSLADVVDGCACCPEKHRAMDRDTWARHVLAELCKSFPAGDPSRRGGSAAGVQAATPAADHPTR